MGDSTTTINHTAAKTATLAMHAVLEHALNHGLDTWRLEHTTWRPHDGITVAVERDQADRWLDTVTVLDEPTITHGTGPASNIEMLAYPATVPAAVGDVRITLVTSRRATQLHLVGGAS